MSPASALPSRWAPPLCRPPLHTLPRLPTPPPCRHCGEPCAVDAVVSPDGPFCCRGCESVFAILEAHDLQGFYTSDQAPGLSQKGAGDRDPGRFAVLDDPEVASRLVDFDDGRIARVTLSIPAIHCASCVWLLEQLWRFDPGVDAGGGRPACGAPCASSSGPARRHSRRIAEQVAALGYEPALTPSAGRHGVPLGAPAPVPAARCGRLRVRQHHAVQHSALRQRRAARRRLPAAVRRPERRASRCRSCSSAPRTISGRRGRRVRHRTMALEVPVALGLAVLFGRSVVDIATGRGEGFLDSFTGLVFFLLIGRLFQQKAFDADRVRSHVPFVPAAVGARRARRPALSVTPLERLRRRRSHRGAPAGGRAGRRRAARRTRRTSTTPSSPASRRRSPSRCGEIVRAGGRVRRPGDAASRAARACRTASWPASGTTRSSPAPKTDWLADVAARFGRWFTVGARGPRGRRRGRVVAGRAASRAAWRRRC